MSAVTVRLPDALSEYLNSRVERGTETKTQVVITALECLRERELETLMREGYAERSAQVLEESEAALTAGTETWPEW
jgi:Arc/MetJ-type ribon-helix-helix transcriptional regulator